MEALKSPYDQKALDLLRDCHEAFETDDVIALADDLRDVDEESHEDDDCIDETTDADCAWGLLRKRIGGLKALRGYVRVLRAGKVGPAISSKRSIMTMLEYLKSLPNAVHQDNIFDKDALAGGYVHFIRYCTYEDGALLAKEPECKLPIKYCSRWCGDATKVDVFVKI